MAPFARAAALPPHAPPAVQADSILIVKSERRLYVLKAGVPLHSYHVSLGLLPQGAKDQQGDYHTPEGHYFIDARKPETHYFLALHLSYPNQHDIEQAQRTHSSTGGDILIHGTPDRPRRPLASYLSQDWTDGCIALSNADMLDLWQMTQGRTPVEIRP
jgi:murein L,D-transpeptidase YafK